MSAASIGTADSAPRRWRRALALLLAIVLGLALVAAGTIGLLLAGSRAQLDGTLKLATLSGPASIGRDRLGTATISAGNRDDVSYALGFVHAQERFFEMDLMRRLAAGELAELVGPAAVKADMDHRRHRLRAVAHAAYQALSAQDRQRLDRYRDGVNAGLARLRVRPWEYLLLRSRPQPWRSEDSLLVIGAMYFDLNGGGRNRRELRLAQLRSVLPVALAGFLLSPDPEWEAPLDGPYSRRPVIPGPAVFDLRQAAPSDRSRATAALAGLRQDRYPGSNSFAVAGRLTETGAAMLANDMHLALRVPNIWFRARLLYPDPAAPHGQREAVGVTLPGTPALVAGSNGQIAWGFTNSYGDWLDWVRVQRDPADPARYKVPGGWDRIELHRERIRIKGAPDRLLQVRDTRWGPIMARDTDGTPLALAWIGDRPRAYNLGVMRLEHASGVTAAMQLGPQLGMPPQNLLVADRDGHIGWTLAGNSVPLRSGFDPQLPADWSAPGHGWQGWADPAAYPVIVDPPSGRLWTANNRIVGGRALNLLGNGGYDLGARAQQIRDDLDARSTFTPGNLLDIQLDNRAVLLTRWQRLLQAELHGTDDPDLLQLRQLTRHWRGRAATGSVDYRLVRAFRDAVTRHVLAPFAARVRARHGDFQWPGGGTSEAAVWALVRNRPAWLLDRRYADWHALLLDSAREVVQQLGNQPGGLSARRWGERNTSAIDHPLAGALPGWLGRWLNMPPQPLAGDNNMPRVAAPAFGASERLDVSPGHEARGILEMPGGQSDNPLSPYYGAGHADWVQGRPTPLLPGPRRHLLRLEPAG